MDNIVFFRNFARMNKIENKSVVVWKTKSYKLLLLGLLGGFAPKVEAQEKWIDGSFYTEANYGYNFFGKQRNIYDFPHVVLDVSLHLGKGWHLSTEQEFEYLSENGDWPKHFSQEHSTNWAYVKKEFSPNFGVMAGVLNIPVGLTSSYYGTGLTVYDPLSESRVLPMKWHETAVAVTGEIGYFEYWLGYLGHVNLDMKDNESMGWAARINWRPNDAFRLGVAGFVGHGASLSKLTEDGFGIGRACCNYADIDYNYDKGKWITSGQVVYQSENDDVAIGAEVGYRATSWLLPFIRYDWVGFSDAGDFRVTTMGVNVEPIRNVVFKLQMSQDGGEVRSDVSATYTLDF